MEEYKRKRPKQLGIVDGMIDWVRVINKDNKVLYANKKMKEDLGEEIIGKRCYEVLCKDKKCDDCLSTITIEEGSVVRKQTKIGERTYTIISSPLIGDEGEIEGSVEVFRDITKEVSLAKNISEQNKKMSEDINFAKNMQKRMLPPKGMYNGVGIDYIYESSESLSGDFFDVFEIDENNTGIYICDVVGHGVTASLLTVFVRQSLRTIAKGNISINKIMKELHKTFLSLNLDYDKYFSIFFGIFNKSTFEFQYVNAGHNSLPVLISDNSLDLLKSKGYPIANIFDNVSYDTHRVELKVGDKILLYTDGLTEATNGQGLQFGLEKLIEIINMEGDILKNIESALEDFSKVHQDDYAVLLAEII